MSRSVTVIKLGGSLLELPELAQRVRALIKLRVESSLLFVVGGGAAANIVRRWQAPQKLTDEQAHWLAIEAMGLNEELLQTIAPELRLVRSGSQFTAACNDGVPSLLCAACFVRWGEAKGYEQLPRNWSVTSDSIAAWVARVVGAGELVLVKSLSLDKGLLIQDAARLGLVDQFFPVCAASIPKICWCNGHDGALTIEPWL